MNLTVAALNTEWRRRREIAVADIVMTVLETLQIAVNNILVWVTVRDQSLVSWRKYPMLIFIRTIFHETIFNKNNIQNLNHLAKDSKGPRSRLALFEKGLIPWSLCLYSFLRTEFKMEKGVFLLLARYVIISYLSSWRGGRWRSVTSPRSKYFPWHKIILATRVQREMHNLKLQTLQQYGRGKRDDAGQFYSILFLYNCCEALGWL